MICGFLLLVVLLLSHKKDVCYFDRALRDTRDEGFLSVVEESEVRSHRLLTIGNQTLHSSRTFMVFVIGAALDFPKKQRKIL